jgi:hypothetical protein
MEKRKIKEYYVRKIKEWNVGVGVGSRFYASAISLSN